MNKAFVALGIALALPTLNHSQVMALLLELVAAASRATL